MQELFGANIVGQIIILSPGVGRGLMEGADTLSSFQLLIMPRVIVLNIF